MADQQSSRGACAGDRHADLQPAIGSRAAQLLGDRLRVAEGDAPGRSDREGLPSRRFRAAARIRARPRAARQAQCLQRHTRRRTYQPPIADALRLTVPSMRFRGDTTRARMSMPARRRLRSDVPVHDDRPASETVSPPALRASGSDDMSTHAVSLPSIARCTRSHVVNGICLSAAGGTSARSIATTPKPPAWRTRFNALSATPRLFFAPSCLAISV